MVSVLKAHFSSEWENFAEFKFSARPGHLSESCAPCDRYRTSPGRREIRILAAVFIIRAEPGGEDYAGMIMLVLDGFPAAFEALEVARRWYLDT